MNRWIASLIGLLLLSGTNQASASLMIEPFIGYEMGEDKDNNDTTGTTIGGRLGVTTLGFMGGIEYSTGGLTVETPTGDKDADTTDLGLFVGFNFPIMLRVYATYFLKSEAEMPGSDYEGDGGTRLGVGFTGLPFISVNLEMITRSYDELNGASSDGEIKTTALTVSLPLP